MAGGGRFRVSRRPPWGEFRAALDAAGFRPARRLGQNFLLDENMVWRIARDTELGSGDFALEVGAGCGFLTAEMATLGVELVSVEIDRRLFEIACGFLAPFGEQVRLLRTDVLAGKHAISPVVEDALGARGNRAWHAVGNLPYSVASPLIVVLARLSDPPRSMTVLVQAEVAERLVASPGSRSRGTLSARLEPVYEARILRRVAPQLFWPRPKVESAVVRLELRSERPSAADLERLDDLVDRLFAGRRKALRGLLSRALLTPVAAESLLQRVGLDPLVRPEALGREALRDLADAPEWRDRIPPLMP